MGQKVDPRSFRLGINRLHDSNWYADKKHYVAYLHEDIKIRNYIEKKYKNADISKVYITRDSDSQINVTIHSQKLGMLLGRKGGEIDVLRAEISKMTPKKVVVDVREVPGHVLSAKILGLQIAQAIEKRTPYKKAMGQGVMRAKKLNVGGVRIAVSGRLNGAEIARTESVLVGKVPLHSLKYDIDFAIVEAKTVSGIIGIKVWISNGIKRGVDYVNA